jgi:hypothetical protein
MAFQQKRHTVSVVLAFEKTVALPQPSGNSYYNKMQWNMATPAEVKL